MQEPRMVTVPMPANPRMPETANPEVKEPIIPIVDAPTNLTTPKKSQYLISASTREILSTVDKMSGAGRNPNIIVAGPQGTGKSELPTQYAATRNRPFCVLEVGRLSDPGQVFGFMDLKEGNTVYVKGLFTQAITTPNCVVHLQEINRPENDKALNALFSVLDDNQRSIWIDELQDYVRVAPGVVFFASMNEGFEFVGTMPLDEALRSRFHFKITLGILPRAQEMALLQSRCLLSGNQAQQVMDTITRLRNNNQASIFVSTRDVVNIADLMNFDMSMERAIQCVLGGENDVLESIRLATHIRGGVNQHVEEGYDYI